MKNNQMDSEQLSLADLLFTFIKCRPMLLAFVEKSFASYSARFNENEKQTPFEIRFLAE